MIFTERDSRVQQKVLFYVLIFLKFIVSTICTHRQL